MKLCQLFVHLILINLLKDNFYSDTIMSRGHNPNLYKADVAKTPFLFLQADRNDFYQASMEQQVNVNEHLADEFFNKQNIKHLQNLIKKNVYNKTGYLIEDQNEKDLLVVMRSLWYQNLREQITDVGYMNYLVVDDVVPGIISNIKMKIAYNKEISQPRRFMDLPVNVNKEKILPSFYR